MKKQMKQILIILASAMLVSMPVSANVGSSMKELFDSVGGFANTTPPTAYKGQTMNGFSGGSLYMRTPVKTYQLATMQAPSLSMGCGGIDLTAGAFSFINKDALISMFKNIGTSLSYAFLLAIQSSMPDMAKLFQNLQDVANKVNAMQINSCEMANGIRTKGLSAITEDISSSFSQVAGSITNLFSDAMASRVATKDNATERNKVKDEVIRRDSTKEEWLKPGNVVWRALNKRVGLDTEDMQLLMSLSGTIVIGEPSGDNAPKWSYFPPLISSVDEMVGPADDPNAPATIHIYKCDTTVASGCLNPSPSNITTTSFTKMVSDKIDKLKNGITNRTRQNISDFKLLDFSSVPIWRLLASTTNIDPNLVDNYKRMVAVDIAYVYLDDLLKLVKNITAESANEAAGEDAQAALKQLSDGITALEQSFRTRRIAEMERVQKTIELERQIQFITQTMYAAIPQQAFNSIQLFK